MVIKDVDEIARLVEKAIVDWHEDVDHKSTEHLANSGVRKMNDHRQDAGDVVYELALTNTEMWHEMDKMWSDNDEELLSGIKRFSPLNQHRNDLMEEVDEIYASAAEGQGAEDDRSAEMAAGVITCIECAIVDWHRKEIDEGIGQIKPRKEEILRSSGELEDDFFRAVTELAAVNTEIWHNEDIVRQKNDDSTLGAVRRMLPLNKYRNDLVEGIDEVALKIKDKENK